MKNSNCEKLQRAKFDHQDGSTYWVGARVVITKHTHTKVFKPKNNFGNICYKCIFLCSFACFEIIFNPLLCNVVKWSDTL